jgi:hypothetical protein
MFDNWNAGPAENMVARDFIIEGTSPDDIGITVTGSYLATNVLIEHLEVIGIYRNSIDMHDCVRCTARYNQIHGSTDPTSPLCTGHGIAGGVGYSRELSTSAPFRTQFYSNHIWSLVREGFYAFDVHRRSDSYELAGNHAENLVLGAKFIGGARNLSIHHNDFENIDSCGFVTFAHSDDERIRNIAFHHNRLEDVGTRGFCLSWGTPGYWQADNLELWYNELVDADDSQGCSTLLMAKMTQVSVKGYHGICTTGSPVEWSCDADPPCD